MPKAIKDQYTGLYTNQQRFKLRHPEYFQREDYKRRRSIAYKKYRIKNPVYMKERKKQYHIRKLVETKSV